MKDNSMGLLCIHADSGTNADLAEAVVETMTSTADQGADHGKKSIPPKVAQTVRRAVVPVDSVVVEETFGREFDDLYVHMLAGFVERYGLRDSITVTPGLKLLAGDRWLTAVKRLGWEWVEVVIVEGMR
jgi:hypothetical protein